MATKQVIKTGYIPQIRASNLLNFADPSSSLFSILGITIVLLVVIVQQLQSDEMVHQFKSPSFNGEGTSSHYLTIENQETNRKQAIEEEIQALRDEIEREENNTVEARFMRNLTSRIYANIARQVESALFGEDTNKSGSARS